MRQPFRIAFFLLTALALSGCTQLEQARIKKEVAKINAKDASNLDAIEFTVADPNEAVAYFSAKVKKAPDDLRLKRYLALSLVRAERPADAASVWADVIAAKGATNEDRIHYADALIRANKWTRAEAVLQTIPPTVETFDRYRLEAMVADSRKEWKKADSYYATAAGLTTTPAGIYNNWGFSKLSRGDYADAERLFMRALRDDPNLFTAKNNLVLARGAERKYELPVIPMTQVERSKLLYTLALTAVKQGDIAIAKGLLQEAIDSNPQYFPAAVRSLQALQAKVSN